MNVGVDGSKAAAAGGAGAAVGVGTCEAVKAANSKRGETCKPKRDTTKSEEVPHYIIVTMDEPGVLTRADMHWAKGVIAACNPDSGMATVLYGGVGGVNATNVCQDSAENSTVAARGLFDGFVPNDVNATVRVSGSWTQILGGLDSNLTRPAGWMALTSGQRLLELKPLTDGSIGMEKVTLPARRLEMGMRVPSGLGRR